MVVLAVRYRAKAGQAEAVAAAMAEMVEQVKQHEPGCLMFHVCRANDDPDVFLLYEQYADEAAFAAHGAAPYFKRIVLETVVPLLESREREFLSLTASFQR
jgi:quinol monooxygenase YgiN